MVTIAAASTRSMRDVVGFLARQGQPAGALEPSDAPCDIPGFVALSEGALAGVGLGGAVRAIEPDACYVFPTILVASGHRRHGIGRALAGALAAAPRPAARGWLIHSAEADEPTRRFLEAAGFERRDDALMYENDATLPGPPRYGGFTVSEYRGGDATRDAAISDLHARGYRGRFGVPRLNPAHVATGCGDDAAYLLVEDAGRLVAYAMCGAHEGVMWLSSFVVARSHWGGPAADAVHDAAAVFTASRGYPSFRGGIRVSNHASRRMAERNGSRVVQAVPTWVRPMTGPIA